MIRARGLSRKFGTFLAVDSLDFHLPRGQVTGFLGPNGAGKTTTIRMLTGFLPPTAGRAAVDGLDVVSDSLAVRRRIGYLPEAAPLYGEMRVREYLGYRARLFGLPRARRGAAIDQAAERCWLAEVLRRPIGQLSKGYRQRVGLAAAMLHDPPVLILDEPTVGLDPAQIRAMRSLVRELAGDRTILLSTHLLPEAELTCDRLLLIARGRIRAQGRLEELQGDEAGRRRHTVETADADAAAALRRVPGVTEVSEVSTDGRWRRLSVVAAPEAGDLREAIAECLAAAGAPVRELSRESSSLEHTFIRMVAEAETDFASRGGGSGAPPSPVHREVAA
jgi:ABC-2 type transport system ATP-binding protein